MGSAGLWLSADCAGGDYSLLLSLVKGLLPHGDMAEPCCSLFFLHPKMISVSSASVWHLPWGAALSKTPTSSKSLQTEGRSRRQRSGDPSLLSHKFFSLFII